jgi:hypothetical protein
MYNLYMWVNIGGMYVMHKVVFVHSTRYSESLDLKRWKRENKSSTKTNGPFQVGRACHFFLPVDLC